MSQTFSQTAAAARSKAARATVAQCTWALADIRDTLAIWKNEDPVSHPYCRQLHCEFDAYSERLAALRK